MKSFRRSKFLSHFEMLSVIFITVSLFPCGIFATAVSHQIDSIRKKLPQLQGKEKLMAIHNMATYADNGADTKEVMRCWDALADEARRQKDTKEEAYARSSKMGSYFNRNMTKEFDQDLPEQLKFLASVDEWQKFYSIWGAQVQRMIFDNKAYQALHEARLIYDDALRRNNNEGRATSYQLMSLAYVNMGNVDESVNCCYKAVSLFKQCNDPTGLMFSYSQYCTGLYNEKQYARMKTVCLDWIKELDKVKATYIKNGKSADRLNYYYGDSYSYLVESMVQTGNLQQAESYFNLMWKMYNSSSVNDVSWASFVSSDYYYLKKDYPNALKYIDAYIQGMQKLGNQRSTISGMEHKAQILIGMGRKAEAADIYHQIIPEKNALTTADQKYQIDQMNSLAGMDELKLEQRNTSNLLYATAVCSVLLILLLTMYIIHLRRVHAKNRIIYEKLCAEMAAEEKVVKAQEQKPDETLTADEQLYRRINKLMREKKLFKDPDVNRETLASELGTNYAYVATAIRNCAEGISVTAYINGCRLNYAATLLTDNPEMAINEVGDMSGFNSRASYNRLFRDKYGMSPSEYRKVAAEKKN